MREWGATAMTTAIFYNQGETVARVPEKLLNGSRWFHLLPRPSFLLHCNVPSAATRFSAQAASRALNRHMLQHYVSSRSHTKLLQV